ncbi:TPA: energy-coupling factor transporter transmembrane component T family protein [Photobacterium damselae]|uniref:Energy-coupling factor transporter transmembrane protein EcfT n=1 Tax=Photobacterium damselae subsp. damselae TaxID=85581 RepID=A0A850QL44_PHODD|nr:energy-coupling factor transporter transmembrane component T [Photobacterium damselae]EJN6961286.1 energy-coupling factor transporter transmembrane protein EcfT [Photobacterium damselae]MBA5683090.1 energy-coupling factor transporter transmembrane protein EcfT [Photobacterium damselae subsp. damselae]NVO99365.1 energy-coupling factor transporter transmembrane protein EcfT [Photobacterium damselae subsp. damselae]TLS81275.1 energy-coupling factor transporter transmembrane protein EcfT [Photob
MKSNKFKFGISYINTGSILHQLNGITKFILFMSWVTMVLITFDLRIICGLIVLGLALLKMSKVPFSVYKPLLIGTLVVLMMNALFMFLIAPNQGTDYMGSKTVLVPLFGHYDITAETLFYLLTVTLKYFSMFPIALVFVFTTHPTEFSASLNKLGVPYRVSYAVSLTLRYLPEVMKDFTNIMHAQQARGVDISKNAPVMVRIKNVAKILGPLIFSSLDRADVISNAMTLRGFGRNKRRTWYSLKPMKTNDYIVIAIIALILVLGFIKRYHDTTLFWYPFH